MLYRLAAETGLRANELRSLTPASFCLDSSEPSVTVLAAYSKRRRDDSLPLKGETAAALKRFLDSRSATAPVFNLPCPCNIVRMLRADLRTAKIDYIDDAGRYADFHSLRHSFISGLAAAKVHPKIAQTLARHSSIELTMNSYTHVLRGQESEAILSLPDLSVAQRATGTDGRSASRGHLADCLAEKHGRGATSVGADGRRGTSKTKLRINGNRGETTVYTSKAELGRAGVEPATHGFSVRCSTN